MSTWLFIGQNTEFFENKDLRTKPEPGPSAQGRKNSLTDVGVNENVYRYSIFIIIRDN